MAGAVVGPRRGSVSVVRRRSQRQPRRNFDKWIFLGPAVAIVMILTVFPFLFSFGLTFTNWEYSRFGVVEFTGLNNFYRLFDDPRFLNAMRNTLIYVGLGIPLQYTIAFGLALLVNQPLPGRTFYRICFMLPLLISPVAVGTGVGRVIFDEKRGLMNELLAVLGLGPVPWMTDASAGIFTVSMLEMWNMVPFMFLILLAGLQALPQAPYEAGQLDGASSWQLFRHVTFPMMLPVTVTVLFIRGLDMFKIIDIIAVTTGGGPFRETESITLYAAQIGLKNMDFSYGATVAWALMAIIIVLAIICLRAARQRIPDF